MSFPLSTAFIVSHKFGYVVPSFSLNSIKSLISFFISTLIKLSLSREIFSFHQYVAFLLFLLLMSSNYQSDNFNDTQKHLFLALIKTNCIYCLCVASHSPYWADLTCLSGKRMHPALQRLDVLGYGGWGNTQEGPHLLRGEVEGGWEERLWEGDIEQDVK